MSINSIHFQHYSVMNIIIFVQTAAIPVFIVYFYILNSTKAPEIRCLSLSKNPCFR